MPLPSGTLLLQKTSIWNVVTLNLKKCIFFGNSIYNLSYIVRRRGLEVTARTIGTLRRPEHRTNLTELRQFLGYCTAFRRYLVRFARVAVQLDKMLWNGQLQTFDILPDKRIMDLETLKAKLKQPLILALPL